MPEQFLNKLRRCANPTNLIFHFCVIQMTSRSAFFKFEDLPTWLNLLPLLHMMRQGINFDGNQKFDFKERPKTRKKWVQVRSFRLIHPVNESNQSKDSFGIYFKSKIYWKKQDDVFRLPFDKSDLTFLLKKQSRYNFTVVYGFLSYYIPFFQVNRSSCLEAFPSWTNGRMTMLSLFIDRK